MAGEWLLGIGFGPTATAAATLDLAVQQVIPLDLPPEVPAIPPDPDLATQALRAALHAAWSVRAGPPPMGLVLAYPDHWLPHQAGLLTHAAAAVGYPANLLRLLPISVATAHNTTRLGDGPALAAARGALLAMLAPAPVATSRFSLSPRTTSPVEPQPSATGGAGNSRPVEPESSAPRSAKTPPMLGPVPAVLRAPGNPHPVVPKPSALRAPKNSVPSDPEPLVSRTPRIWAAALVLGVVIAGGTIGVVVLTARGDETLAAATTVITSSRPAASASATTTAPTTTAPTTTVAAPPPETTNPPPPPPPEPAPPAPEPPPTTTPHVVPTVPVQPEPEPAPPDPTTQAPRDMHDAAVRGYCQGLLNQADKFPGGLAAMRAQVPPPFLTPAADWSEAFDRAESGSCQ